MANILEFLRGVLTDTESQRLFRSDPHGFVVGAGFGDLTGEDVVEAIAVLRRSLLPDVSAALADFDDESRLPPVRPSFSETELDAAVRQLHHAIDRASSVAAGGAAEHEPTPAFEPEPEFVHDEPIEIETEPELAEPAPPVEVTPPPQPAMPSYDEPVRVEHEPDFVGAGAGAGSGDGFSGGGAGGGGVRAELPSVQALGTAITAASADVKQLLDEYAEEVFERLSAVVEQGERDAAMLRAEAERDAAILRAEGEADRELARKVLLDARDEAERIRTEAAQEQAEIDARRNELRGAERELKDRLAGLDAVFRTISKDE